MDPIDKFISLVLQNIVNPIITLLGLAAFVLMVYGIVVFIGSSDNEEKRATGQRHILWGFIGMVILFGANAIIALIASTIGVPVPR
jgi:hypothetical protein